MKKLEPMYCPEGHGIMTNDPYEPTTRGWPPSSSDYNSCLRRCEVAGCGLAYSNGKNPTLIFKEPLDNIPAKYHYHLKTVACELAMNETNRPNKLGKMAYSSSEDALTWVVFRAIQECGTLKNALSYLSGRPEAEIRGEITLSLWGVKMAEPPEPRRDLEELQKNAFQEVGERLSEIDILLECDNFAVICEAKLGSGNAEEEPDSDKWVRYNLQKYFLLPDQVKGTRYYQLARFWCIGSEYAAQRVSGAAAKQFYLINLVPKPKATFEEASPLYKFQQSGPGQRFMQKAWADLIRAALPAKVQADLRPWLAARKPGITI